MRTTVQVDPRYEGFHGQALGGYVAGLLMAAVDEPVAVSLRAPVTVGTTLTLAHDDDGLRLLAGDAVVAEARPRAPTIDAADPIDPDRATTAARAYWGFERHLFRTCFCCGPGRDEGDGLRIFTGPLDGTALVAAPWMPAPSVGSEDGSVAPEIVASALDCPALWALITASDRMSAEHVVSGRFVNRVDGPVVVGQTYVVGGWVVERDPDAKTRLAAAAIWDEHGDLVALSEQTCVVVPRGLPLGFDRWGRDPRATTPR